MERRERFELDVAIGSSGYFVREASSGIVAGPKNCRDGIPRKITVPINTETGEARNIHMKSGRGRDLPEDWRIYPQEVISNIETWIDENSYILPPSEIREIERSSYSFSVWRALVSVRLFEGLSSTIFSIVGRGLRLFQFRVEQDGTRTEIRAVINPNQILRLTRRLRPFLGLYVALVRTTFPHLLKRMAKLHMVRLTKMSDRDVSLVFSKQGSEPLVILRNRAYRAIPLERAVHKASDWYSKFKIAEMMPDLTVGLEKPLLMQLSVKGSLD